MTNHRRRCIFGIVYHRRYSQGVETQSSGGTTMTRKFTTLTLSLMLFWATARLHAQDPQKLPEDVQKAQKQVDEHLKKLGGTGAQILWLGEDLTKLFPDRVFFAARFRIYPVARKMPEGMKPTNVFVVNKDGTLVHVKNLMELQNYFAKNLPTVKDEKSAKGAVKASLQLAQEFHQDGMYKFTIMDESAKVDDKDGGKQASGKAVVMQGGNGEMVLTLTFDAAGKLTSVTENAKIKPGPRPICQATKLLDADPIVRRMAEQDLLYMGLSARDYLMEQRDLAGPELRREIDRLWQKIVEAGW
jgi:hypothetical protein